MQRSKPKGGKCFLRIDEEKGKGHPSLNPKGRGGRALVFAPFGPGEGGKKGALFLLGKKKEKQFAPRNSTEKGTAAAERTRQWEKGTPASVRACE